MLSIMRGRQFGPAPAEPSSLIGIYERRSGNLAGVKGKTLMAVTFINAFTVPEDQDAAFQENWKKTSELFADTDGFIEVNLYQIIGSGEFRYITVALWESADALNAANRSHRPNTSGTTASMPGVTVHPGMYQPFITIKRSDKT